MLLDLLGLNSESKKQRQEGRMLGQAGGLPAAENASQGRTPASSGWSQEGVPGRLASQSLGELALASALLSLSCPLLENTADAHMGLMCPHQEGCAQPAAFSRTHVMATVTQQRLTLSKNSF